MKRLISTSLFALLALAVGKAQTYEDYQIVIDGWSLQLNGLEMPAKNIRSTGSLRLGALMSSVYSMSDCGYFSAGPGADSTGEFTGGGYHFDKNMTAGWKLSVTPLRVADKKVTFRLKWVRTPGNNTKVAPGSEDLELSLKPGEYRTVDLVAVPPTAKTRNGEPCGVKAAGLRVSVEYPQWDRRLIGADVWLVQRLPNGREQSQLQSVRGVPHREIPFYFDSIADGTSRVDFSGNLTAELDQIGVAASVLAVRVINFGSDHPGVQFANLSQSSLQLKPDEIVEVALPPIVGDWSSLTGHRFSLRIRAKQLR